MRASGILMPIFSLPGPYGIGTLGQAAYDFVDFLAETGQTYWQMLPIGPTGYGDSPYQSFSAFAGNPYFIDPEFLLRQGLLTESELPPPQPEGRVDYGALYQQRPPMLQKAAARLLAAPPASYQDFCAEHNFWLDDHALFMAVKAQQGQAGLDQWPDALRTRQPQAIAQAKHELAGEIAYHKAVQFLFYQQWTALKAYANRQGVKLIGDIPIYVSPDSSDLWTRPDLFQTDGAVRLTHVAGCPPDAFSADGQLWGNPLFRWDAMKKDGYSWWTKRVKAMSKLYDIVRIDHFRGFDSYYAIPAKDDTARNGEWRKGPGMDLFRTMEKKLGKLNIIVEDLGFLTPSVLKLVKDSGFPGMKVIQFAFDSREGSDYLPHNYEKHCVVYTGTHDNDTLMGWMKTAPKASVKFAKEYLNLTEEEGFNWGMMRAAWASVGDMAIVPMQDLIGIGSEGRMNTPSTLGGNWEWRATSDQITGKLAKRLYKYMEMYGRLNKDQEEEEETEAEEKKVSAEEK